MHLGSNPVQHVQHRIPFACFVFAVKHWLRACDPFYAIVIGAVMVGVGAMLIDAVEAPATEPDSLVQDRPPHKSRDKNQNFSRWTKELLFTILSR